MSDPHSPSHNKLYILFFLKHYIMYYFIDLCCGFGAMTKAFERTGLYHNVLAADTNENMQNLFSYLFNGRKPIGDIRDDETKRIINNTAYDVLIAGIAFMEEEIFFNILDILENDLPKAFVLELSSNTIDYSYISNIKLFCDKYGYHFVGLNDSLSNIDDIKLNLQDFGIPEYCERIYCVCIKKEWCRIQDPLWLQLNKKHDFNCYEYVEYDPENHVEQRRGVDWGFGDKFRFLPGTPDNAKETIIDLTTPMPMAASVALDLGSMMK